MGTVPAHAASHATGGTDPVSLTAAQITSGVLTDARIPATITRDTELTAGLATKAAVSHTHTQANITGLVAALAAKANASALGTAAAANVTDFDAAGAAAAVLEDANAYTDAAVLEVEIAGGGVVDTIVGGSGITVNATDPQNPVVSLSAGGVGGASWELQPYLSEDEPRVDAEHVIWYPVSPDLGDPENALDEADLLFRDGVDGAGGGTIFLESVVGGTGITVDVSDPTNPIINATGTIDSAAVSAAGALLRAGGTMSGDIVMSGGAGVVGPASGTLVLSGPGAGAEIRLVINALTRLLINETSVSLPGSMQMFLAVNPYEPLHAVTLQYLQANYQQHHPTPGSQSTTSYTLVLADAGRSIMFDSAGATTVTIPANADVAIPIGSSVDIIQTGTGQVTVVGAGGVVMNKSMPTAKARARYSVLTAIKLGTDYWVLTGDAAAT
jgi:hypothetical protein